MEMFGPRVALQSTHDLRAPGHPPPPAPARTLRLSAVPGTHHCRLWHTHASGSTAPLRAAPPRPARTAASGRLSPPRPSGSRPLTAGPVPPDPGGDGAAALPCPCPAAYGPARGRPPPSCPAAAARGPRAPPGAAPRGGSPRPLPLPGSVTWRPRAVPAPRCPSPLPWHRRRRRPYITIAAVRARGRGTGPAVPSLVDPRRPRSAPGATSSQRNTPKSELTSCHGQRLKEFGGRGERPGAAGEAGELASGVRGGCRRSRAGAAAAGRCSGRFGPRPAPLRLAPLTHL